jgi:predicted dehydrogenase
VSVVRIAVVGAGHMGRHHAEKVVTLRDAGEGVELAGVADIDPQRARDLAGRLGAPAATEAAELFAVSDAAIVAVPTVEHYGVARAALESGLDVMIEKPIAATLEEAEALLERARASARVLVVGHQEWFNAALREIRTRIHAPRFVEAHRMGPFPDRGTDVDVVRDLMIHDLEILQQLVGEEPDRIDAIGIPVITDQVDIANARIGFPGGCVANLTASRVSSTAMRKLRIFQKDGYFTIDFLAQTAAILRRLEGRGDEAHRIEVEELKIDPDDALLAQLRSFVADVRTRSMRPVREAIGALRTALRVIAAMPPLDEL